MTTAVAAPRAGDPDRPERPAACLGPRIWGGILVGGGGFNLFDGIVDHKLLGLHQVREGAANLLPYDVAWIGSALLILGIGRS